jgi:hypothetical protein
MRRHELDPVSLVFGFAFTAAGALFLAGHVDQAVRLRWLWPLLLLALGLGILLDVTARRPRESAEPAAASAAAREAADAEPAAAREPADAAAPEPADAGDALEPARPADAEPMAGEPVAGGPVSPEPVAGERVSPEEATRSADLDPEGPPERDR